MLSNLIVTTISRSIGVSNHYSVHLKSAVLYVDNISVELGERRVRCRKGLAVKENGKRPYYSVTLTSLSERSEPCRPRAPQQGWLQSLVTD